MAKTKSSKRTKRLSAAGPVDTNTDQKAQLTNQDLFGIQWIVNNYLYDATTNVHLYAVEKTDESTAMGITISALATTLGVVCAQIPELHRATYVALAQEILEKSIKASLDPSSLAINNQIGHA